MDDKEKLIESLKKQLEHESAFNNAMLQELALIENEAIEELKKIKLRVAELMTRINDHRKPEDHF